MESKESKGFKKCNCKCIEINIKGREPAEPKGLKEPEYKNTDFTINDNVNEKKITVYRCEVERIMNLLVPEEEGKSTYWYRGVYACGSKKKRYGVKKIGFLIFYNHNHPSHNFTPSEAGDRLKELGFGVGKDETVPRSGWKKEDMSGWLRKE